MTYYTKNQIKASLDFAEINVCKSDRIFIFLSNLDDEYPNKKNSVTPIIFEAIELITGVTEFQIKRKTRFRQIVAARQIAAFLIKKYTNKSLNEIGKIYLGGRDHTTVIHSIKSIKNAIEMKDYCFNDFFEVSAIVVSKLNGLEAVL